MIKVMLFRKKRDEFTTMSLVWVENELKTFQDLVGGYIDSLYLASPCGRPIYLLCNEEGKLQGLPSSVMVFDTEGEFVDLIAGDCVIVALDTEGNFCSITEDEVAKVEDLIRYR